MPDVAPNWGSLISIYICNTYRRNLVCLDRLPEHVRQGLHVPTAMCKPPRRDVLPYRKRIRLVGSFDASLPRRLEKGSMTR